IHTSMLLASQSFPNGDPETTPNRQHRSARRTRRKNPNPRRGRASAASPRNRRFNQGQPDMIACGEADCIPGARSKIAECKPQLLLTALRLGTGDSLEFVKALKAEYPSLVILVYSAFEESIFAERALRAGANGYLMKKAAKEEMVTAIRDILSGQIYISRDLALRTFQKSLVTQQRGRASGALPMIDNLSDREMHVFQLIGSGLGTKEVAHALNLSVKT